MGMVFESPPTTSPVTAGSDGQAAGTMPETAVGLWTGAGINRLSSLSLIGDGTAGSTAIGAGLFIYNGTGWDRLRETVPQFGNFAAAGIPATAIAMHNGGGALEMLQSTGGLADGTSTIYHLATHGWVFNGNTMDRQRTPIKFITLNALSITTETTIWTPATGKKFRLMGYVLASSPGGNVILRDNTAGTIIRVVPTLSANVSVSSAQEGNGTLSAAANNVLTATGAATANLSGYVFGTEE